MKPQAPQAPKAFRLFFVSLSKTGEVMRWGPGKCCMFRGHLGFGATPALVASWIWALGLGMGLCSLVLSLVWRQPVMVA